MSPCITLNASLTGLEGSRYIQSQSISLMELLGSPDGFLGVIAVVSKGWSDRSEEAKNQLSRTSVGQVWSSPPGQWKASLAS
jgi:hypothetical protein